MSRSEPPSLQVQMLVALLYGGSAAHASFLVGLMWLRPELDMGAIVGLMFFPFIMILAGFVPVVLTLTVIRLAIRRIAPRFIDQSMLGTLLLSLAGLGIAVALTYAALEWLPEGSEEFSAILLGSAIGGVVSGYMVGTKGRIEAPEDQP